MQKNGVLDKKVHYKYLKCKYNAKNGTIKIITGMKRVGKTYLLFTLFYEYLISIGIEESNILRISFEDYDNRHLSKKENLYKAISEKIEKDKKLYVLLDEIQVVENFEKVLISFLNNKNVDIYVTGSNAKFLSKDIITEFRGRGDQIQVYPLSFKEFKSVYNELGVNEAWNEYITYGGLPGVNNQDIRDKAKYLSDILNNTYIKDVIERNSIRSDEIFDNTFLILASSIGSLTNPNNIVNTFNSKHINVHYNTISNYIIYLENSFLISKARLFDIKGRKIINSENKFYFGDVGIRNVALNFRQNDESHILENIIYNELIIRGYNVDVGRIDYRNSSGNGGESHKYEEVDFVCNDFLNKVYVQVALEIPNVEKMVQETNSFRRIRDSFKKIIITKHLRTHYTEEGILILNLFDFLLDEKYLLL